MDYNAFTNKLLEEKLIKKQDISFVQIEKMLVRANKDLDTARTLIETDEAIAYTARGQKCYKTCRRVINSDF